MCQHTTEAHEIFACSVHISRRILSLRRILFARWLAMTHSVQEEVERYENPVHVSPTPRTNSALF
jgi:hypothetical protein